MASDTTFYFLAAVRGFHVYRDVWRPYEQEFLKCNFEIGNTFDMFAIKVCKNSEDNKIIGHLPREISRPTKFLIDRGATVTATVRSKNVRRSPLYQGGLEILCNVKVVMPKTRKNQLLLDRYRKMVNELYSEPENDIIVGTFDNAECLEIEPRHKKKKTNSTREAKKNLLGTKSRSILSFFKKEKR